MQSDCHGKHARSIMEGCITAACVRGRQQLQHMRLCKLSYRSVSTMAATEEEQQQSSQNTSGGGVPEGESSAAANHSDKRRRGIGVLPDEVLVNILKRVSCDTGNAALHCMEVCKRWKREARSSIVRLDIRELGLRHFTQGVLHFEGLTHLTMQSCVVSMEGWSGLALRCRHLSVIRLEEVSPPLNNSDMATLLTDRSGTLEHLQIIRCLDSDDGRLLEHMTSLRSLDLTESRNLPSLPPLAALTNLTALCLKGCSALRSVPGLEGLAQLRDIDLTACVSLDVPHTQLFCRMSLLETLCISSPNVNSPVPPCTWYEITENTRPPHPRNDADTPYPLCRLPSLQHFSFTDSPHATDLPSIHSLSGSLLSATVSECPALTTIAPLADFHTLQRLHINLCDHLHDWQFVNLLPGLQELSITQCRGLRYLKVSSALANLTSLDLSRCLNLQDVLNIRLLTVLRVLNLSDCRSLRGLEIENLSALEDLHFRGCQTLHKYPSLRALRSLRKLDAYHSNFVQACSQGNGQLHLQLPDTLERLQLSLNERTPSFHSLTSLPLLNHLALDGLTKAHWLPLLTGVPSKSLLTLKIYTSTSLTSAVPLKAFATLQKLHFQRCNSLKFLPDVAAFPDLQEISLVDCESITHLPPIRALPKLRSLVLEKCTSLEHIPSVAVLPLLRTLTIGNCASLKALPSLHDLPSLRFLKLSRCSALERLPDLGSLHSLRDLDVSRCQQLHGLPPLSGLTSLERIDVSYCSGLVSVPALDGLHWLREICVREGITVHGAPPTAEIKSPE